MTGRKRRGLPILSLIVIDRLMHGGKLRGLLEIRAEEVLVQIPSIGIQFVY